jgi:hypothetical protein
MKELREGDWVAVGPAPMDFGVVSSICWAPGNKRVEELYVSCVTGATLVLGKAELKSIVRLKKPNGLLLIKEALQ